MLKNNLNSINTIDKSISGIYAIVNTLNNHKYIGSSMHVRDRLYQHRALLRRNRHHSIHLQNAYNKYGEDKFIWVILEMCEPIRDTLIYIEQKYLDLKPEYNIAQLASCPAQLHQSQETKDKRAAKLRGRKRSKEFCEYLSKVRINQIGKMVDQYDLQGNYLRTFNSTAQASRFCGDYTTRGVSIQQCCKGKIKSCYGYQWRWHSEHPTNIGAYVNNSMNTIEQSKKKIDKLDLNGNLIRTYNSISDAARDLNVNNNIITVCSNIAQRAKGKGITAYGYKWRYAS